jgi:hypothetical protein
LLESDALQSEEGSLAELKAKQAQLQNEILKV